MSRKNADAIISDNEITGELISGEQINEEKAQDEQIEKTLDSVKKETEEALELQENEEPENNGEFQKYINNMLGMISGRQKQIMAILLAMATDKGVAFPLKNLCNNLEVNKMTGGKLLEELAVELNEIGIDIIAYEMRDNNNKKITGYNIEWSQTEEEESESTEPSKHEVIVKNAVEYKTYTLKSDAQKNNTDIGNEILELASLNDPNIAGISGIFELQQGEVFVRIINRPGQNNYTIVKRSELEETNPKRITKSTL